MKKSPLMMKKSHETTARRISREGELPPTKSGHSDKEFSTLVGKSSRIT